MIRLEAITFSYDPGYSPTILKGIDTSIREQEMVGILGRNGSGKSTLARLLNGLLLPTTGRVEVEGAATSDASSLPAVRRAVQMVFQNPESQQVGATVFEDIAFGLANIGVPTDTVADRVAEALETVGLDVEPGREVDTLSGGQLQRLALASTLALRPRLLLLDEATSMLDVGSRRQFLETIHRLREALGLGVVHITHDLSDIESADRLVVLDDGRIIAEGTPREVFADAATLERAGLELPYRWRRQRPERTGHPVVASEAPEAPPRLEARDVIAAYGRTRRGPGFIALNGTDVMIRPGELVAVAGPSGAGKSTLMAALKGLIRPVSGEVLIDGRSAWAVKRPVVFDRIGYAFQHPDHQLFATTVGKDVGYGLSAARVPADEAAHRISVALRRVGLDPKAIIDRSPFELSGGQKRRVAIAGILVSEPTAVILDEPTAGLDLPSRTALFRIVEEITATGAAVVWVSHHLPEILAHAPRVVILADGKVLRDAPPFQVFSDREVLERLGWPIPDELDPAVLEGDAWGVDREHAAERVQETVR